MFKSKICNEKDLILVSAADPTVSGPDNVCNIGCKVRLNSGGPEMVVVDFNKDSVTVAYKDITGPQEITLNPWCVHRI